MELLHIELCQRRIILFNNKMQTGHSYESSRNREESVRVTYAAASRRQEVLT